MAKPASRAITTSAATFMFIADLPNLFCSMLALLEPRSSAEQVRQEGKHKKHQKNKENDLRNARSRGCYSAKSQDRSDHRNDQKSESPTQHGVTSKKVTL